MIDKIINTVICGNAREKLKELPTGKVNLIATSPPFWALRDYGIEPMIWDGETNCEHKWGSQEQIISGGGYSAKSTLAGFTNPNTKGREMDKGIKTVQSQFCSLCGAWRGCLGLEPTIELYLKHLVGIFDEAKRVLRDDGVCFVNLGDTYNSHQAGNKTPCGLQQKTSAERAAKQGYERFTGSFPEKCLCLIPFRFAIEMVNHGWILRNTIIWSKPNPMPSSAKDRFTVDFEYVFFFVKKKKYWFEPQYEEQTGTAHSKGSKLHPPIEDAGVGHKDWHKYTPLTELPLGRNKRTTWTIPTEAFPEAHFATFPCALVEPMIKCGCPEYVCPKCGKARVKVYEKTEADIEWKKKCGSDGAGEYHGKGKANGKTRTPKEIKQNILAHLHNKAFRGYTSCSCNAGYEPGVVVDFFSGAGTVGKVAAYLRRNYILIDAKKEYCQMAKERIAEPETGVPVAEQRQGQGSLFEREGQ